MNPPVSSLTPSLDGDIGTSRPVPQNTRPAPRGLAAYPRRRAVKACQTCRARRTKCDNAKPSCSFCLKVGARCVQSQVDLSSYDPASLRILERLDELEQVVKATAQGGLSTALQSQDYHDANAIERERKALSPDTLEETLRWPCFRAHIEAQGQQRSLMSILRHPAAKSSHSALATSPASIAGELEPRTINVLLNNFFHYCHVKNPILTDEPAVRRMAVEVCLHGVDWSPQSCLVLLICALGTISTPFGPSDSTCLTSAAYSASWSYFKIAQKRLGTLMDTPGVIEAQCMFLAGVYLMCVFRVSSAWRCFSQALACCQDFDSVANASSDPVNSDTTEIEQSLLQLTTTERVIYWSSWKSERELRSVLQPQDFPLVEKESSLYPSFFPNPPRIQPGSDVDDFQLDLQNKSWYFYLTEISLHRLASRTASDLANVRGLVGPSLVEVLVNKVSSWELEIEQWTQSLPSIMSPTANEDTQDDDVAKFVIRGHLNNLYELLYWPFLVTCLQTLEDFAQERENGESIMSHRHRAIAELALRKHMERLQLNRPGYYHRHHGTWFMIRSCTRSALVLLRAALVLRHINETCRAPSSLVMPSDWQQAVFEVLELNRYWAAEAPDAEDRLQQLEEWWHRLCVL